MDGLARLALIVGLAAGCNQSLFDSAVDEGPSGDDIDAGTVGADASTERSCPDPCEGDPIADFALTQGGSNGRWFYRADVGDSNGATYTDLTAGTYNGVDAWVAANDTAPAIINCADHASEAICAGVFDSLLFVPTPDAETDPVLVWVAPRNGTYRLAGQYRTADGATTGLAQRALLSRNSRNDQLVNRQFLTSATPEAFSVDVEALEGDTVMVTLAPNDADSNDPVAFNFYVTLLGGDDIFPGNCMFAATFDSADPFVDRCLGASLENLSDGIATPDPGPSTEAASVNAQHGTARQLVEGQFIRSTGGALDYRDDFTVQFWANLVEPQPSFDTVPFADWHDLAAGGVNFSFGQDTLLDVSFLWDDGGVQGSFVRADPPRDQQWHFYRLTRDAAAGTVAVCVDGVLAGMETAPAMFDMTSDTAPHMGRNVDYNPAYFGGLLDDVRVFKRAMPCATGL